MGSDFPTFHYIFTLDLDPFQLQWIQVSGPLRAMILLNFSELIAQCLYSWEKLILSYNLFILAIIFRKLEHDTQRNWGNTLFMILQKYALCNMVHLLQVQSEKFFNNSARPNKSVEKERTP